jgi:hypothetical protein
MYVPGPGIDNIRTTGNMRSNIIRHSETYASCAAFPKGGLRDKAANPPYGPRVKRGPCIGQAQRPVLMVAHQRDAGAQGGDPTRLLSDLLSRYQQHHDSGGSKLGAASHLAGAWRDADGV